MNLFRRQPINDRPKGRSLCWVPLPESVHADTHDAIHITSHTFGLTARFEFLEFESMLGGPGVTRYMNPGFQISNRHSTSGARDTPRHDTHARYNTIPALAGSVLAMRVLCRGVWVPGPIEGSSIGNPEPVEV